MKKIILIITLIFYYNFAFSLEVKTSKILGGYKKQSFSTSDVIELFYTKTNNLLIKGYYFGRYRFFQVDYYNNIEEIEEKLFLDSKIDCLDYSNEFKFNYILDINDELIAYETSSPEPRQRDYNPTPLFFYIKDKNDEIIFNFNQWKINHEEYYPHSYFNSLCEEIFYTEESRLRIMKINAVYTVKDLYCINKKKNKIAIVLDNYNSEGECALIIFDILYNARINDFRVRLRSEPNLDSQIISYFYTDDSVKILDQTDEKYEIDGESWYWYKVESGTYPVGWVYGKYLNIEQ